MRGVIRKIERVPTPEETLATGRGILEAVLVPHGFVWVPGTAGRSSGGDFASGSFVRGNRRLELSLRHSLGHVTYHVGEVSLDHAAYMRVVVGGKGGNQYPGYSSDPIDGFRHLSHDLGSFCQAFLEGSEEEFRIIASNARTQLRRHLP